MREFIRRFDILIIGHLQKWEAAISRTAIFVVYFWFGFLKLVGASPALPLIQALFEKTIDFVPFSAFNTFFSVFEIAIGILFLLRGLERFAIFLVFLHLIATALPLVVLPEIAWQAFLCPTLEGQYIIKNILIAALAVVIGSRLAPIAGKPPH